MEKKDATKRAEEFVEFCKQNPTMRFWQALSAFTKKAFILTAISKTINDDYIGLTDTFYESDI